MTVSTLVNNVAYTGNGVSTIFTYPFYIIDASHLQVWVNGALQPTSAYTVNSVGNLNGGEVVLATAPPAGIQLDLRRLVPATQLVDYRPYDPFPAEVHEQALDKLTMIVQGQGGYISNSVRAPLLEPVGQHNLILPTPAARANFLLGFDSQGNVAMYQWAGLPPFGISDHGELSGLADNDHPQYMLRTEIAAGYLPLSGGTMTGPILLPPGFPGSSAEAVNKAYVDTFVGSVITKNVISDANGDAQGTVEGAWNTQANATGITRASNEIIYYRWQSTDSDVYRYVGGQQGPTGWATVAKDWVPTSGVNEAPMDGNIYGRQASTWEQTVARTGGSYLGKVQGFAGPAAAADLARTDEVQVISDGGIANHVALLNPHNQYMLKTGGTVTGPMLFPDGALAAPGIAWANEPTSGIYRAGANAFHSVINNNWIWGWNATSLSTNNGIALYVGGLATFTSSVNFNNTAGLNWRNPANDAHWEGIQGGGDNNFHVGRVGWTSTIIYGGGGGNLVVHGGGINVNGSISVSNGVYAGNSVINGAGGMQMMWDGGTYSYLHMDSGWKWQYNRSSGDLRWVNWQNQVMFTINSAGGITTNHDIYCGAGLYVNSSQSGILAVRGSGNTLIVGYSANLELQAGTETYMALNSGYCEFRKTPYMQNNMTLQARRNDGAMLNVIGGWNDNNIHIGNSGWGKIYFSSGGRESEISFGGNQSHNGTQLRMTTCGFYGGGAQWHQSPVLIESYGGDGNWRPGLGLHYAAHGVAWCEYLADNDRWAFSKNGGGGPLGGDACQMSGWGEFWARVYYTVSLIRAVPTPKETSLTRSLDKLLKLNGIRYHDDEGKRDMFAFSLDEMKVAFPELVIEEVYTNGENITSEIKSLDANALLVPIVEAIRELNYKITALEAR